MCPNSNKDFTTVYSFESHFILFPFHCQQKWILKREGKTMISNDMQA